MECRPPNILSIPEYLECRLPNIYRVSLSLEYLQYSPPKVLRMSYSRSIHCRVSSIIIFQTTPEVDYLIYLVSHEYLEYPLPKTKKHGEFLTMSRSASQIARARTVLCPDYLRNVDKNYTVQYSTKRNKEFGIPSLNFRVRTCIPHDPKLRQGGDGLETDTEISSTCAHDRLDLCRRVSDMETESLDNCCGSGEVLFRWHHKEIQASRVSVSGSWCQWVSVMFATVDDGV